MPLPGQYVAFRLTLPSGDKIERNYSLSDTPGKTGSPTHYRVSIKRVPGGAASNFFHDRVFEGAELEVSSISISSSPQP